MRLSDLCRLCDLRSGSRRFPSSGRLRGRFGRDSVANRGRISVPYLICGFGALIRHALGHRDQALVIREASGIFLVIKEGAHYKVRMMRQHSWIGLGDASYIEFHRLSGVLKRDRKMYKRRKAAVGKEGASKSLDESQCRYEVVRHSKSFDCRKLHLPPLSTAPNVSMCPEECQQAHFGVF